ncbi:hypothetical protein Leryth_016806 [Lithospermum erythrorhizon]|nr:hypothetical protein Leryth_016806 [Lithospermum erythrorhizon]
MVPQPLLSVNFQQTDPNPLEATLDIEWPFSKLEGLGRVDFREAAYDIFFATCRSTPGFGGKGAVASHNSPEGGGDGSGLGSGFRSTPGSPRRPKGVGMAVTSHVKTALGLKMLKRSPSTSRRSSSVGSTPLSPAWGYNPTAFSSVPAPRPRRPMTSAEIMRRQMRVTEQGDNRLRKTLQRTLVGQMGRRAETIILPLELLRHLKPSEFYTAQEYHLWQKRQLKILELGLLLSPFVPLEKSNSFAKRFREIIQASETKAIDTSKNSELMKSLCSCVNSLACRSADGSQTDICHWADGYPLNIHIYLALLYSIFDIKEETVVLDEVDELLELMKKTWNVLGINRSIHNLCFSWALFERYVATGQVEHDLLGASLVMLYEVSADAKKVDIEPTYVNMLGSVLMSMKKWAEKRLANYHENFHRGTTIMLENMVPFLFTATRILEEDVPEYAMGASHEKKFSDDSNENKVDYYIRVSLQKAFTKMLEDASVNGTDFEWHEAGEVLIKLAKSTEDLFAKERDIFSTVLKKWNPDATGIAAVTLHTCYSTLLRQYLSGSSSPTNDIILVLHRAGKLETTLIQMVVEDSDEDEDADKYILKEMVPYKVDSLIKSLLSKWIEERMKQGEEIVKRAKETETWNPKSENEPYAQTASELTKNAKETIELFFEIPSGISEDFYELTNGLEQLFREYITLIASCGSKQSYLQTLPPLTRCGDDSKLVKLLKRATYGVRDQQNIFDEGNQPRPSTSRGTKRLYVRLNTLHYLLSQLQSIDKTIAVSPTDGSQRSRQLSTSLYFDSMREAIQEALQHVAEVAAYRLIFLDSNSVLYGSLYARDVTNVRIAPALRIMKPNLCLLCSIVTDKAQLLALKEVMKASFEAYLMVLLAGGSNRAFTQEEHEMIEEDFKGLKSVFCMSGEGIISEDLVDREAETVEGVVALMGQTTDHLIEYFTTVTCEASGIGVVGEGQKLPMPPTTGRWNRSDANTILRVLCHRNDKDANDFLKRTFQLPKRKF